MENTGKVLFEDDTPQWYVAMGSRWIGPLAATDVYQRITSHEITWAHFVWRPGQADWERICDVPTFQSAVPTSPTKDIQQQVKEASKPSIRTAAAPASRKAGSPPPKPGKSAKSAKSEDEARLWFLFYNDSQFGPFSGEEISRFLRVGKIHGRVHIWKDGMGDWERLESIDRFADDVAESKRVRDAKKSGGKKDAAGSQARAHDQDVGEQRKAPRRPLVAKILMADDKVLSAAVCRDISVGGMQVLTDRIPGEPGAKIKLNVSPAGGRGGTKVGQKSIEPFVAEGTIVRILEDGRGFSFRFHKLPDRSRQAIEDYIRD